MAEKPPPPPAGFDYCFWSKLLVAIVLFPLVIYITNVFFSLLIFKVLGGALAIAILVYAAILVDSLPCLSHKIPPLLGRKKGS